MLVRLVLALALTSSAGCSMITGIGRERAPEGWTHASSDPFFFQMSDTQFGMWDMSLFYYAMGWPQELETFARETANMEKAIAEANRLRPRFVIICGDLIHNPGNEVQTREFLRIAAQLDDEVPLYLVPGNHDVTNRPTPDSISWFRENFGPDHYSFQRDGIYGIILNSTLLHTPEGAPDEATAQLAWLDAELEKARAADPRHLLVFLHHPLFLEEPDEDDDYFNIPKVRRLPLIERLQAAGVTAVLAGHAHRNSHGRAGDMEMITTGPVGMPVGPNSSGFRIVRFGPQGLFHSYFELDEIPDTLPVAPPADS